MKDSSDGWLDLDTGPKASGEMEAAPVDRMMIIWHGRMGVLASPQPSKGTRGIAECVAEMTGKNTGAGFTGDWGSASAAKNPACRARGGADEVSDCGANGHAVSGTEGEEEEDEERRLGRAPKRGKGDQHDWAASAFQDGRQLLELPPDGIKDASDEAQTAEQAADAVLGEARMAIAARQIEAKGKDT